VSYGGALQQGLSDLAAWVERGVRPLETSYRITDTQVVLPAGAEARRGIQPVIALTVNGSARAEVRAGEAVMLEAVIEAPPGAGRIVSAEWDLTGEGLFAESEIFQPAERVALTQTCAPPEPGTHFAVLRATLQRNGRADGTYGRVQNIARVRLVVS
jgi:hypothetical protein